MAPVPTERIREEKAIKGAHAAGTYFANTLWRPRIAAKGVITGKWDGKGILHVNVDGYLWEGLHPQLPPQFTPPSPTSSGGDQNPHIPNCSPFPRLLDPSVPTLSVQRITNVIKDSLAEYDTKRCWRVCGSLYCSLKMENGE